MDRPTYRWGISEFTTKPWSFEEDFQHYARLGADAIEVCEVKLDKNDPAGQVARAIDAGLMVSTVQPAVRTLYPSLSQPEPKDLAERVGCFKETIRRLAPVTPGVPYVSNTGPAPKGNIQEVFDTAVREYRDLAEFAADHGVKVALEPLNAAIMNEETAIWTLAQGRRVVEAVDHDSFGLCLDFWNVWQNADIEAEIRACGEKVFIVQLSDWRTPQSFQDRLVPGQGEIPLPVLLRAAHESGYSGPYIVEIFSGDVPDSLWKGDLARLVEQCHHGVEQAWNEVF